MDNKTTLDPEDDAARVNMGGRWRMPTRAEQDALRDSCTWTWQATGNTAYNGVAGYKVTGPNGNSVFLPAAGYRYDASLSYAGKSGYYWSVSLNEGYPEYAYNMNFSSGSVDRNSYYRYNGHPVRAVLTK